jgi:hypothetical protein
MPPSATDDGAARARRLRAAVGFALVPRTEPELRLLHRWLDWPQAFESQRLYPHLTRALSVAGRRGLTLSEAR